VSDLSDALETLRAAVAAAATGSSDESGDEGVRGALETSAFDSPEVVSVPKGYSLDHVKVVPAEPLRVSDLEAVLGPARRLPRTPSPGHARTVLFEQTVPEEGSAGATVLAEVDDDDRVTRLIVRADRL
jgi:hypothetical protein